MTDFYRSSDFLPHGEPIEGWGGTFARDHNHLGLFATGPQPACPPWHRLMGTQVSTEQPLPPAVAVILTREVKVRMHRARLTLRQAIALNLPRRQTAPISVGRKRVAR